MTKEPIMIDDVEVSKCEFFDECEVKLDWSNCLAHCSPYPEGACYDHCSDFPNCYYKQLKRKEEECERLKEEVEKAHNISRNDTEFLRQRTVEFLDKRKEWAKQLDYLKAELESTKGLVTVGNKQFIQAMEKIEKLEAENKELKNTVMKKCPQCGEVYLKPIGCELYEQLDQLKAENEKMSKGYEELTEIVSPYIDDFTGYNEELKGFDIVLCVKELMQQLNDKDNTRVTLLVAINDQLKAENKELKTCYKNNLAVLRHEEKVNNNLTDRCMKAEQALQEIEDSIKEEVECKVYEIENDCFNETRCKAINEHIDFIQQILQKCEVIDAN